MAYRLEVIGPPRIVALEGASGRVLSPGKPLALLSFLVVEGRSVPREELGSLLWPSPTLQRSRQSVRQAIWYLRRTLGEDVVVGNGSLEVSSSLSSDVAEFELALRDGDVDVACDLWRGPLLSELALTECRAWDRWLEEQREALRRRFFQALMDAAGLLKEEGRLEGLQTPSQSPGQESLGRPPEFVGRSEELADLKGLWRRARTGQGAVGFIEGPVGNWP